MNLNELQACCLDIAKDIDRVCEEYEIDYSLCGGSVIGAHLYQGFIPWDDDIDLMMTRENYDRFLEIYPHAAAPHYHLRHFTTDGTDNVPMLFARVEDTRTTVTEEIARTVRDGRVFVDITVFDGVPNRAYLRLAHLYSGYVYTYLFRKNEMVPRTGWKRAIVNNLPGAKDDRHLLKKYESLNDFVRRRKGKGDPFCAELLSAAFSGILYESRIFDAYVRVPFEDAHLMLVRDYEDYLFMRYGRREFPMEVPEDERQEQHIRTEDGV